MYQYSNPGSTEKDLERRDVRLAQIKPFRCLRPNPIAAASVASLPYDVYSREEAKRAVCGNPNSFLNIDRPETQFDNSVDMYSEIVYQKARELLIAKKKQGLFLQDPEECYYLYELTRNGKTQTGIVGCASAADYREGKIRAHETTRREKELDRFQHILACHAQTGPVFLLCRDFIDLYDLLQQIKQTLPIYDFYSEDGIRHRVFRISEQKQLSRIADTIQKIDPVYIADGHHRAAAAAAVAAMYEKNDWKLKTQEAGYFLSVLFCKEEVTIYPYYRIVKDLAGMSEEEFLRQLNKNFEIHTALEPVQPDNKGEFGLCLKNGWYRLTQKTKTVASKPLEPLNVSILQEQLLGPILQITDPKTDARIGFVGGVRGVEELERRVHTDMAAAFSLYPISAEELFHISDLGEKLPPKSTWFEPKLRSGLFLHELS